MHGNLYGQFVPMLRSTQALSQGVLNPAGAPVTPATSPANLMQNPAFNQLMMQMMQQQFANTTLQQPVCYFCVEIFIPSEQCEFFVAAG
jgi:hypothetical protein